MSVPEITLTGKLATITGAGDPGAVVVTLVNFGDNPPVVTGTSIVSEVTKVVQASADGTFSVNLWGNYQLDPDSTYYQIGIQPSDGTGVELIGAYLFDSAGTFDLSTLKPLDTSVMPAAKYVPVPGPQGAKGDKGDTGNQGVPGTAATVQVGSTTTLPAGSSATVANGGTSSAAVLNFAIPQGAQGIQGIQGVQGDKGDKGDQGDTGSQGVPGIAATVSIGSVSTLAPGSAASVVNSGTSSASVLDFGIPQGATGAKGDKGDTGEPGQAASITVGTVTTGAAGTTATVTNSGNSSSAVLDFTIPQGSAGAYDDLTGKPDLSVFAAKGANTDITSLRLGNGSASAPSYSFANDTDTGMRLAAAADLRITTAGSDRLKFVAGGWSTRATDYIAWGSSGVDSPDLTLYRDAANTLALRNGTNAHEFRVYNTYTDSSNYERLSIRALGTYYAIGQQYAGTGSPHDVFIEKWKFSGSGNFLASTDNTYDIGASGANRPRNIYAGTGFVAPDGGQSTPGYGFATSGYGLFKFGSSLMFTLGGGTSYAFTSSGLRARNTSCYGFSPSIDVSVAPDAALSRTDVATIAVGNGTAGDASGTLKAATLLAGNVGIGNTSPRAKLTLGSQANATGEWDCDFRIGDEVTNKTCLFMGVNSSNAGAGANNYAYIGSVAWQSTYNNLALQPNGGNVGIGTTSPGYTLDVNGAINASSVRLTNGSNILTSYTNAGAGDYNSLVQAGDEVIIFKGNGTDAVTNLTLAPWTATASTGIRITGTGALQIGGTDIAVSRSAAGVLAIGNGTAGNKGGYVDCAGYRVSGGALDFHDLAGSASTSQLPARTAAISYVIDGGGSVPTVGAKGQITVPTACTITGWYITADAAGTATVNVNQSTYAGFPTVTNKFSPSLSSAQKNSATGLSYAVAAGDQIQFAVSGTVTTCTRLNITLIVSVPYA